MLNFFKKWTKFEICLFVISEIAIIISFVFSQDKNYLSFAQSILGIASAMFVAKGFFFAPFLSLVVAIIYIILSIQLKYYGEVVVYTCVIVPVFMLMSFKWTKNRKNEDISLVKTNHVSKKEFSIVLFIVLLLSVGLFFLYRFFGTEQLFFNVLSTSITMIAAYLLLRRNSYYGLAYCIADIVLFVLWLIPSINNTGYLPIVVCEATYFVNDLYGFLAWKKREKMLLA